MKLIYKIVIISIICFIFSLGMSFADSNIDENNNTKELNNSKNEMTELEELNTKWDENEFSRYWKNHGINQITARTGIHTGGVIAGNIGSNRMLQYSTIGDTVNVASRLEKANKEFNTEISFSHEIYTALEEDLFEKSILSGEITLKGRTSPTKVYSF